MRIRPDFVVRSRPKSRPHTVSLRSPRIAARLLAIPLLGGMGGAPGEDEATALRTVSAYQEMAGTQAVSALLGCRPLNPETALLAEFSVSMLSGVALCAGRLKLADR